MQLSPGPGYVGSPPRVRSRRRRFGWHSAHVGITSACAEQTRIMDKLDEYSGDHLRVCGADRMSHMQVAGRRGSPPRVRSRRGAALARPRLCRITSACAEQTIYHVNLFPRRWDHLRVCGADFSRQYRRTVCTGSPPRVRSRLPVLVSIAGLRGITSACAEQTEAIASWRTLLGDHLRVCGADGVMSVLYIRNLGSPPRVRSRQHWLLLRSGWGRITSACAEQTICHDDETGSIRDHLRVCGADSAYQAILDICEGSPPRVRSRPSLPPTGA